MEDQEYVPLEEAAHQANIKRATMWNYVKELDIKTFKAGRDRRSYITKEDAEKLQQYKATPWKFKVEVRKKATKEVA